MSYSKAIIKKTLKYVFFGINFLLLFTIPVHAYIDPSVMTYAIQALAGITIAMGTVVGVFWRKLKKWLFSYLNIDGKKKKASESDSDIYYIDAAHPEIKHFAAESRQPDRVTSSKDQKEKLTIKYKFFNALPVSLLLAVTFFMAIPGTLFLGNINEFRLSFASVFPTFLCDTIVSFLLLELIAVFLPPKVYKVFTAIVFWLGIMFYAQGAFLNPAFRSFDGVAIDWSKYQVNGQLSTFAWAGSFLLIILLFYKYHKASSLAAGLLCIAIVISQLVSLINLNNSTELMAINDYHISKEDEFSLSKSKNTIVIVLDTLDSIWFETYIQGDPDIVRNLKDFTYYSDCVSGGATTRLGVPLLMTGVLYDPTQEYNEIENYEEKYNSYLSYAYDNSRLFRDLRNEDYIIRLFTEIAYTYGCDYDLIDSIKKEEISYEITNRQGFYSSLLKLTLFFVAPQFAKDRYWMARNEFVDYIKMNGGENGQYTIDDPQFYIDMNNEFVVKEDRPVYSVYHLFGAHGPYYMDENSERVKENLDPDGHLNQIRGCFNIVITMINYLKEAGIYDNTNIIVTADHGFFDLYQNAAVLYKAADTHQNELQVNEAPVSFVNLYNSIAKDSLIMDEQYGETLQEVPMETIDRYHSVENRIAREVYTEDKAFAEEGYSRFIFHGKARDWDLIEYDK